MELKAFVSQDAHPKPITCVAHNLARREVWTGSEDALIRAWDTDSGRLTSTMDGHAGWVTALVFCKEIKCMASASQDGTVLIWSNNGKILQRLHAGEAVYCMAWNSRRNQLMCGQKGGVRIFQAKDDVHVLHTTATSVASSVPTGSSTTSTSTSMAGASAAGGSGGPGGLVGDLMFDTKDLYLAGSAGTSHTDLVSCLMSCEARFYSGGFDRRLIIYESMPHGLQVQVLVMVNDAHDAGITCMEYAKDAENAWIITGSFDRTVKLWSLDGNCLQRFDGFLDSITGLAYVPPVSTLWIACNSLFPVFLDPRSGLNISDFVKADNERVHDKGASKFKQVHYLADTQEVVAFTARRQLLTWRHNPSAPVTTLESDAVDAMTLTLKDPILIFSGGAHLVQWERTQLNTFMYSREPIAMHAPMPPRGGGGGGTQGRRTSMPVDRHRSAGPGWRPPGRGSAAPVTAATKSSAPRKLTATRMMYYDPLDLLIVGFEEKCIMVWGYQADAGDDLPGSVLAEMGWDVSTRESSVVGGGMANRISGLSLRYQFDTHRDAVTSLGVVAFQGSHYLLSSGWDRRIYIYDLTLGTVVDVFRDIANPLTATSRIESELAADAPILDLSVGASAATIAASRPSKTPAAVADEPGVQFAYASADKLAYVRAFTAPRGDRMPLRGVLQGHEAEVMLIQWNAARMQWVTGSEDKTIRFWDPYTFQCSLVVNNESPVTAMCIDPAGLVVTGSRDHCIRTFDGERLLQRNIGHTDEVRAVAHIPSLKQYVSSSWDGTIRIWNAHGGVKRARRGFDADMYQVPTLGLDSVDSSGSSATAGRQTRAQAKTGGEKADDAPPRQRAVHSAAAARQGLASALGEMEEMYLRTDIAAAETP
ncbi:hypothetical protein GGF32_005246 [Allomyces javanicus]|nr:hypothetical protein GGF32_005246 [Allomyces javanicus]